MKDPWISTYACCCCRWSARRQPTKDEEAQWQAQQARQSGLGINDDDNATTTDASQQAERAINSALRLPSARQSQEHQREAAEAEVNKPPPAYHAVVTEGDRRQWTAPPAIEMPTLRSPLPASEDVVKGVQDVDDRDDGEVESLRSLDTIVEPGILTPPATTVFGEDEEEVRERRRVVEEARRDLREYRR